MNYDEYQQHSDWKPLMRFRFIKTPSFPWESVPNRLQQAFIYRGTAHGQHPPHIEWADVPTIEE